MIDEYSQLVTILYQYLLFSYDRKHDSYVQMLDNICRRLNVRNPETALYEFDVYDLLVAKSRLDEFDLIYDEIMSIIQSNFRINRQLHDDDIDIL